MKIVLLGDSIRLVGYGPLLEAKLLKDGYKVFQPSDNCRYAKYTLRMLFDLKKELSNADIIHFNIGHWDLCSINGDGERFSTIEEYKMNMARVAKLLLKITPHVIFSTTTPVTFTNPYNKNEDIDLYNQEATKIMNELGIKVNDLNALMRNDIDRCIRSDDYIHLTDFGSEVACESIYNAIKEEIKKI